MSLKGILKTSILFIVALFVLACTNVNSNKAKVVAAPEIMVFAAASLINVITEIIDSFENNYTVKVKLNIASSGTLARQIEQGGQPDIYLSANKKWANYIDRLGFVYSHKTNIVASNNLVLIAPNNSSQGLVNISDSLKLNFLLNKERLAMGNPNHVPAGTYAKQALQYYGIFNQVSDKLMETKDVRTALMLVEMNEASLGIVYKSDAIKSDKVKIIGTFNPEAHQRIAYIASLCSDKESAALFLNFLTLDKTLSIWEKYGFND